MFERKVVVASAVGLHARPAVIFCQAVAATEVTVLLTRSDGTSVNAASILGVLSLGIAHGDEVIISTHDNDAAVALDSLAALLATDLDAE